MGLQKVHATNMKNKKQACRRSTGDCCHCDLVNSCSLSKGSFSLLPAQCAEAYKPAAAGKLARVLPKMRLMLPLTVPVRTAVCSKAMGSMVAMVALEGWGPTPRVLVEPVRQVQSPAGHPQHLLQPFYRNLCRHAERVCFSSIDSATVRY